MSVSTATSSFLPSSANRQLQMYPWTYGNPACGTATVAVSNLPCRCRGRFVRDRCLRGQHEQRAAVVAAEHARIARLAGVDHLEHLAALRDQRALRRDRVRDPDIAVRIERDAVGHARRQIGPEATIRQRAVGADVERGQPTAERFADDQRLAVRRDHRCRWESACRAPRRAPCRRQARTRASRSDDRRSPIARRALPSPRRGRNRSCRHRRGRRHRRPCRCNGSRRCRSGRRAAPSCRLSSGATPAVSSSTRPAANRRASSRGRTAGRRFRTRCADRRRARPTSPRAA